MRSTTREDGAETTERRTAVEQVLYGEADPQLRATWRVLFSLAVFVGLVALGETILSATGVPPVITELKLPYLAAVAGAVVVAVRLGDRSASGVGFGVNVAWFRDPVAGVGMGVIFQCAVTVIWAGTGGLTVTDTIVRGVATGPLSLALVTSVSLFGVLVTAVWEEFVFRSLLIRNAAEGLAARGVSPTGALGGAIVLSALAFGLPHAFGVAAEYTNPAFGALQAVVSVSYFVAAYAATGSLALPIGIHFASNAWVILVVGRVSSPGSVQIRMKGEAVRFLSALCPKSPASSVVSVALS